MNGEEQPMSKTSEFDSTATTLAHILEVRAALDVFVKELLDRGRRHDTSKLGSVEKPAFDAMLPRFKGVAYGTPEYLRLLAEMRPALEHHYANNSHHPEHYGAAGIAGMDLFDLVEMICDWMASAKRNPGEGVKLDYNVRLFDISPQLVSILKNTLERWPDGK
jgi:hypothetical protein